MNLGISNLGSISNPSDIFASLHPRKEVSVIIKEGSNLKRGQVLGKVHTVDEVTTSAKVGNVGNGVLTLANPAYSANVKIGRYTVAIVEEVSDAGAFVVADPDGIIVGSGNVAVAFDGVVKFTIADGGTDFKAGDTFYIDVTKESDLYVAWNPTAQDGSQHIAGILGCDVDADEAEADTPGFAYVTGEFLLDALIAHESLTVGSYNYGSIVIKKEYK